MYTIVSIEKINHILPRGAPDNFLTREIFTSKHGIAYDTVLPLENTIFINLHVKSNDT